MRRFHTVSAHCAATSPKAENGKFMHAALDIGFYGFNRENGDIQREKKRENREAKEGKKEYIPPRVRRKCGLYGKRERTSERKSCLLEAKKVGKVSRNRI